MRKAGTLLLATLVLLTSFNYIAYSTQAGLLTEVYVDIVEPFVEVNVEPGSIGRGTFSGNVTCQNYNTATALIVNLFAESTIGNPTLDKPQVVFQGGHQSEEIKISLLVPIIISEASEDHKCTITGYWQQGGTQGEAEGDFTQVIILPFYFPLLRSDKPDREIDQGDQVSFDLLVNNTGNIDDIYRFEIEDADLLEEDGVKIDMMDMLHIPLGGSKKMDLTVRTSSDTPTRTYGINIILTSVGSEEESDEVIFIEYLLIVRVNEKILGIGDIAGSLLPLIIIIVLVIGGFAGYQRKKRG